MITIPSSSTIKWAITIAKLFSCLALTALSVYIIALGVGFFLMSREIYFRSVEEDSTKNSRGDEVYARTDFGGGQTHPSKTVLRLKREGSLLSTTLLEANSYEVSVRLKWQDDNDLVVQLDFGCDGTHSTPVQTVGPIHIHYQFGDPGELPPTGHETGLRPDGTRPCN